MPNTLEFFTDCVRYNRPCELKGLANDWPAVTKWADNNGGGEYLKAKFGDKILGAFTGSVNNEYGVETRKFSFRSDKNKGMTYSMFTDAFDADNKGVAMKDGKKENTDVLLEDVVVPDFYKDVAALDHLVFY